MSSFDLKKIQGIIKSMGFDGWLFFDFRGSNDLALSILNLPKESHLTRRFFYFIPKDGNPKKIVNAIESGFLDHLPGEKLKYANHSSLTGHLKNILNSTMMIRFFYLKK